MDVQILAESAVPIPPTGYVTLFINTDKNNALYGRYPDGSYQLISVTSDGCACEIAEAYVKALSCSLEKGMISATSFQEIMEQGLAITTTVSDDGLTTTTSVGSRAVTP